MPKCDSLITATAVDPARRRLWTGQQDGTITLHLDSKTSVSSPLTQAAESPHESSNVSGSQDGSAAASASRSGSNLDPGSHAHLTPHQPPSQHTYATTGAPTSCMSVASDGTLWVGDGSGRVTRLRPAGHVLPNPAAHPLNPISAARLSIHSMTPASATLPCPRERFPSVRTVVLGGSSNSAEICAILAAPNSGVFAADVSCQLFRIAAELCEPVTQASCAAYGPVNSFVEVPWFHAQSSGCSSGSTGGRGSRSSRAESAAGLVTQMTSSLPAMPEGEPLDSFPDLVTALQQPVERWRLLSGHVNGQILVWDLTGGSLTLTAVIGTVRPAVIARCDKVWYEMSLQRSV